MVRFWQPANQERRERIITNAINKLNLEKKGSKNLFHKTFQAMTVSCEETTEEISFPTKESKNRRTLSESDVNRQKNVEKSVHPPAASAPSRNPMSNTNISSSRNVTEDFQQKRSHSLPHRYKIPHPNMAMISGARGSNYYNF